MLGVIYSLGASIRPAPAISHRVIRAKYQTDKINCQDLRIRIRNTSGKNTYVSPPLPHPNHPPTEPRHIFPILHNVNHCNSTYKTCWKDGECEFRFPENCLQPAAATFEDSTLLYLLIDFLSNFQSFTDHFKWNLFKSQL